MPSDSDAVVPLWISTTEPADRPTDHAEFTARRLPTQPQFVGVATAIRCVDPPASSTPRRARRHRAAIVAERLGPRRVEAARRVLNDVVAGLGVRGRRVRAPR